VYKKAIYTLLLMSLFLNITHAAVISFIDRCEHQTLQEYIVDIDHGNDCGDFCDTHHMFHISAIPVTPVALFPKIPNRANFDYSLKDYIPPFLEPSYRPPIV